VLALLQHVNVKRTLAYSSVAHTGYMMAALAALGASQYAGGTASDVKATGVQAVLFYLAAYGLMNVGAFGILQLLPAHDGSGSAETFDDLLGAGRHRVALGLCMSVCCFSLTGIPLTVGFMAKLMIIKPALAAAVAPVKTGALSVRPAMAWLAAIVMVNAAISAAYYLRIVATMFLRTEDPHHPGVHPVQSHFARPALPILIAVILSVGGTLLFGMVPSATELLGTRTLNASSLEGNIPNSLPIPPKAVAATR
jgi:NADH-quinone oxidoreductase subunit N